MCDSYAMLFILTDGTCAMLYVFCIKDDFSYLCNNFLICATEDNL